MKLLSYTAPGSELYCSSKYTRLLAKETFDYSYDEVLVFQVHKTVLPLLQTQGYVRKTSKNCLVKRIKSAVANIIVFLLRPLRMSAYYNVFQQSSIHPIVHRHICTVVIFSKMMAKVVRLMLIS